MIIENGSIKFKHKSSEGGIDPASGYAIRSVPVSWSDSIPCQYSATRFDWQAIKRGEPVTNQGYAILIEEQECILEEPSISEQLMLSDMGGKVIGEFSIKQIEPLTAVGMMRIIV